MFGLPRIIEYLLALERPEGGKVAWQGMGQVIIPAFPPGESLEIETVPDTGIYLKISYAGAVGREMVPGAFSGVYQEWGFKRFSGTISQWVVENTLSSFVVTSAAQPIYAMVRNDSPVVQYYEGISFGLNIASKEDYDFIREELKHLSTSARSEQLAQEATLLLRQLAGGAPAPRPPVGAER